MNSVKASLLLLAIAGHILAQQHPQFVWQGAVDGIDVLRIHGNRVQVQVQEGAPVHGAEFHFYDPLPETKQNARLEVIQGRGYAHIVDQPTLDNQYTLAISIEDRQPGSSFYSIAVYWDTSNLRFEHSPSARSDTLSWSGRVSGEAMVSCHDRSCTSDAAHGGSVSAERFQFSRPLPHRDVDVTIDQAQGQGQIRLVEQPRQRNNYTARISIRDPQGGASEYSFTLVWNRRNDKEAEPVYTQRGLVWSGRVDGRVRVTVQGGASFSEVIAGRPVTGEHAEILNPLPARSDLNPSIHKMLGRGNVSISEYPSEKNHYRLVFEVNDPGPGADNYEVEIDW